ncbi:TfoX/Sxy family protein [Candidatus Saccharibacteria bacterium]|nr:TfoX/Sxy family protein [Candidatus Saccharibacteria bacterium]
MASTKEYRDYILEQLEAAGFSDVRCRPMMGEYLLYVDGVLVGGIYDDRLLLKKVEENEEFQMEEAEPYPGAKPMWLVGEADDKERLGEIVKRMVE